MSSIPDGPKDDWSSASQELFRASRSDHAPSAADRERVRRALARRVAETPGLSTGAGHSAGRGLSALPRLLKVGFGVSLVVVAAIAVKRAEPARIEPSSVVQPMTAKQFEPAPAPTESAAQMQGSLAAADSSEQAQVSDDAAQARTARRARAHGGTAPARALAGTKSPLPAVGSERPNANGLAAPAPNTQAVQATRSNPGTGASASADTAIAARAARSENASAATLQPAAAHADSRNAAAAEPQPTAARTQALEQLGASKAGAAETQNWEASAPASQPQAARTHSLEAQDDTRAADARAELAFLRRIQAALRAAESASVIELCVEHERRWPDGTFVQEREGLRAIASCNATQPAADARARAFLLKYPRTPLGPRVREACKLQLKPSAAAARVQRSSR